MSFVSLKINADGVVEMRQLSPNQYNCLLPSLSFILTIYFYFGFWNLDKFPYIAPNNCNTH